MIRFLHGADFHLDSAFGALPPGQAAARRRESRELALRLADYVKEHGIDLVLLAGDLFDSASPFRETGEQLAAALGQMRARVFISPGNHDWYGPGSPWETVDWPENVYVFKENRLTAVEVPERNLVIHGAAFSGPEQPESLLAGFTAPADGKCHIGLLHGELDGAEARYGPIRREEAAASGLCYLALGHVHKRTAPLTLGRTVCAWPGCPEGRGFDELGEKGFYEGTISDGGEVSLTFVPFARHRYEVLEVDVTGQSPGPPWRQLCRRRRPGTCTASSSPARPERAALAPRPSRRRWRTGFTPWRSGTAPVWRRTCGGGRRRTPSGACFSGSCASGGSRRRRKRNERRSTWRPGSAWQRWTTGIWGERRSG